jgi:hypothetical protein
VSVQCNPDLLLTDLIIVLVIRVLRSKHYRTSRTSEMFNVELLVCEEVDQGVSKGRRNVIEQMVFGLLQAVI